MAFRLRARAKRVFRWAHDVNDKGLIELITAMDADGSLEYALANQAACGSGAIAATITAAQTPGCGYGHLARTYKQL